MIIAPDISDGELFVETSSTFSISALRFTAVDTDDTSVFPDEACEI